MELNIINRAYPDIDVRVVLFVGSFAKANAGEAIGGQTYACRSLLKSNLSKYSKWLLLDSTLRSKPLPNIAVRVFDSVRRLLVFMRSLIFGNVDTVLIFSAYQPLSLLEKGLMVFLAHLFRKRAVISFRSEILEFRIGSWFNTFVRLVVAYSDAVMCQSQRAADDLAKLSGQFDGKIAVVPNWIDASNYSALTSHIGCNRHGSPVKFLYLSRLERSKGILQLIYAVNILRNEKVNFRLIICGGGSLQLEVSNLIHSLELEELVECRGWVHGERKMESIREADVIVLPSFSEGFPNAVLEGMAAGLAIVATPVGGIPAIVESQTNGLYADVGDHVSLATAMKRLVEQPYLLRKIKHANRNKILEQYDIGKVWPQIATTLWGTGWCSANLSSCVDFDQGTIQANTVAT